MKHEEKSLSEVINKEFEGTDNYWLLRSDILAQIQNCMIAYAEFAISKDRNITKINTSTTLYPKGNRLNK